MPGATETRTGPEVAPMGTVIVMDVALQEPTVAETPPSVTTLAPCVSPKPLPEITSWLPTAPVDADRPVITGAGLAVELTDTLSKFAVNPCGLTAKPM